MSDFDEIVESYMPAAEVLEITRDEVESAVFRAIRMDRRCESCRHSRAPWDLLEHVAKWGVLPIYKRRCIKEPRRVTCPRWERLEIT